MPTRVLIKQGTKRESNGPELGSEMSYVDIISSRAVIVSRFMCLEIHHSPIRGMDRNMNSLIGHLT